ncbi:hypothetical protein C2869_15700 [Saccharobesus litoralis]|uniref:Methyltransferase domain-containing protein n=1 Tax=Saccharobesus litoralis TaxID=2172099 RepID=A0A2S0VU92_9ALTE|nr:class I SAM-dependent methyltransferase [Saccharobesus litoralis]AWB67779.1 hypothetical protein C2869_15700 [Saccharobesus litoralis]
MSGSNAAYSSEYWSEHMVHNDKFESKKDALNSFYWRSDQYIDLLKFMPVNDCNNKVVLDYGCGPGYDLFGFSEFSDCKQLIGMDVSQPAMDLAKYNLDNCFGQRPEFYLIDEKNNQLPLSDSSVDYIHSSGVLHHCYDLDTILEEFHRVLKDDGEIAIMVYNYDSLYLHLHTAWMQPVLNNKFVGLPIEEQFRLNSDGGAPISKCYKPSDFKAICESKGFECEFVGCAMSIYELKLLKYRFAAIEDKNLDREHRQFLLGLTFDERNIPYYNSHAAGIDSCFKLKKVIK